MSSTVEHVVEKCNAQHMPLVDLKVHLPPSQIKLCVMKNFVKPMCVLYSIGF